MPEKKTIVFVYGTLKSGNQNSHLLSGAKKLGVAVTIDRFLMFTNPTFPSVYEKHPNDGDDCLGIIKGEAFEVDARGLEDLDSLEGYNRTADKGMYVSRKVAINIDGNIHEAEMYFRSNRTFGEQFLVTSDADGIINWNPKEFEMNWSA